MDEVNEVDLMPAGNIFEKALHRAALLRGMAKGNRSKTFSQENLRNALLLEELVRYCQDRDREMERLVRMIAELQCKLETAAWRP